MINPTFPFAAIVGQDALKLALLLCAVNPLLSGVLIRGDKGTAKSTAARGLRELLAPIECIPGCLYNCAPGEALEYCDACRQTSDGARSAAALTPAPFINLPLGATEDRVLGSLDLERVLKDGKRAFQPGLLACAHRGILYIDEVNLLADHLVDALLDVAAMGQHTVQREGLSLSHPACITLVGTMNAEEGELRPQLLDRFAMMVEASAPNVPALRTEVVRRRLAFEADPAAFITHWQHETDDLRDRIKAARDRLGAVELPNTLLEFVSELCCEFGATSLRADIMLNKVARTHAAFADRSVVDANDVVIAAELVLPHRRRRKPFESPALDRERLDDALRRARDNILPPSAQSSDTGATTTQITNDTNARPTKPNAEANAQPEAEVKSESNGDSSSSSPPQTDETSVFIARGPTAVPALRVNAPGPSGQIGRRSAAPVAACGAYMRAVATPNPTRLAVDASLRHAIQREPKRLNVTRDDLHSQVLTGRQAHLILLVVDASGSMAARRRMEAVKGCVLGLLHDAYRCRDSIGMIAFRGESAELVLPPTRNLELAQQVLQKLPTGGRTPLGQALELTAAVVAQAGQAPSNRSSTAESSTARSTPMKPLVVLLSDGRSNVPPADLRDGDDPWRHTLAAAARLAAHKVSALVLDTEQSTVRLNRARLIAEALHAEYMLLDQYSAQTLTVTIQQRLC